MHTDAEEPLDPVEELVAVCLQSTPAERPSTVDRVCADHPELAGALRRRLDALDRALVGFGPSEPEMPERLGDFRILRRLGGGGMGVVYEAEQESLGRVVALKLIRPEQLFFPRARERFRREVEAVAALQHPGIVPVYAVGEEGGVPYFAMERLRGCTLAEALRALADRAPESLTGADLQRVVAEAAGAPASDAAHFRGAFGEACVAIVRRVAEALDHAHGRGIVHRDVKPSNVLLTADGRVMLFDFGLTPGSGDERVTRTGSLMGTLPYMSPEQVRDAREVGPKSDVYSLGVTFYECLTLQLPFEAETPPAAQARIIEGRPDPIRTRNRRVAADLETVCLVAMDVDPGRRYTDAAAFARDLAHLEARRPIEALPPGPVLRARRWVQRHPVVATASALGAILVAGIPTALYLQERAYAEELRTARDEVGGALTKERLAHDEAEAARLDMAAERERAMRSADMAQRSLGFVTDMYHGVSPLNRPGPMATNVEMLEVGAGRADEALADHPTARGRVQMMLGQLFMEYGRLPQAVELLDQAIESFPEDGDPATGLLVFEAKLSLSDALRHKGELARCAKLGREQVAWAREAGFAEQLRYALSGLASTLGDLRRFKESDEMYAELFPLLEGFPEDLAMNLLNHGGSLSKRGRYEAALPEIERGHAILADLYDPPNNRLVQATIAQAYALRGLSRYEEAEALFLRADEEARLVWGEVNQMSAITRNFLSSIALTRGDLVGAEEHGRAALELHRQVFGEDSPRTAAAVTFLRDVLVRAGRPDEARDIR